MRKLIQFYRYLNILSVDVVGGAVIGALFFSCLLQVRILPYGLAALALTVWIIYTADHLWDAKKIKDDASSRRHFFHQRHFRTLSFAMLIALVADIVLLFYIRTPVFVAGLLLSCVVILYLLLQRRFYFLKEIFVAALYTLGITLPSLAVASAGIGWKLWAVIVSYFLVSLLNLLLFSLFDRKFDAENRLGSFVTRFGSGPTTRLIRVLFMIATLISVVALFFSNFDRSFLILLLMLAMLLWIFAFRDFFSVNERYRLIGDAIFFLPVFYLV